MEQLVDLMNSAIDAQMVGVIGLATAVRGGPGLMWHLREALSRMGTSVARRATRIVRLDQHYRGSRPGADRGHLRHRVARPMAAALRWLEIPSFQRRRDLSRPKVGIALVFLVLFTGLGYAGAGHAARRGPG